MAATMARSSNIRNSNRNSNTPRPDGRSDNTLRPLSCELGCLQNCDGSAEWKSGYTAVLAAVHGPTAPRILSQEDATGCHVSVVIKSGDATNTYEREWEACLIQQLAACVVTEDYPRSVVSVVLQVLTADGSVLGACLHAAVSALMDAGVALRGLPVAVTCALDSGGRSSNKKDTAAGDAARATTTTTTSSTNTATTARIQLDPMAEEEQQADSVVVVFLNNDKQILGCHTTTSMRQGTAEILTCLGNASRAVPAVHAFWRLAMEQKATRESQTLWSGA